MRISLLMLRYIIYFSLLTAPYLNPAVVVMYDLPMFFICFISVPLEIYLAYSLSQTVFIRKGFFAVKGRHFRKLLAAAVLPFLLIINFSYIPYLVFSVSFSAAAFLTTYFLFRFKTVFISFAEALFYLLIYTRLIGFSSALSSENTLYTYISAVYFLLLIFSWFLVSFYYFRINRADIDFHGIGKPEKDFRREYFFLGVFFVLFALVVFVFQPDGSRVLDFVLNFSNEKALPEGGGSSEDGEEGDLRGIPADRWGNRSRRDGSGSRQYAVMVVASKKGEIYSAWDYLDRFDSVKGFLFSDNEPLNSLKNEKFIENWINPDFPYDSGRDIISTFYLSAIPERSVPYLPFMIEPTVYDTSVSPFSYSYSVSSFISAYNADKVPDGWELSADEKNDLSGYLYSEIDPEYRKIFTDFVDSLDLDDLPPGKRIKKILKGFSNHQYEIGYDENTSVEKLSKFLSGSLTGDCTEFANTAAVIGRLAGIPSRVVRGYLASRNLQTPAHVKGIMELQKNIDVLKNYPLEDLLLVTTAHKHAWVQFYLSDYGWIDFETTGYAIPPAGMDMNDAQVVVPVIRIVEREEKRDYIKGIFVIFRILLFSALLFILLLYVYKFSKTVYLLKSRCRNNREYAVKRYRYILLKFFTAGYPVKKKYMTPSEYSFIASEYYSSADEKNSSKSGDGISSFSGSLPENFPLHEEQSSETDVAGSFTERELEFINFAKILTEVLYRENYSDGESEKLMERFEQSFKKLAACFRKAGMKERVLSFFSLRGVFY